MSTKVTLGEQTYDVPNMNVGQIEDMSALDAAPSKWTFLALAIVMRRATPAIADIQEIECAPDHMRDAIESVMRASGYKLPDPKNLAAPDQGPGQMAAS